MVDNKRKIFSDQLARQFQYTVEMSQQAVFWIEQSGQFTYVNKEACRS